MRRGGRTPPVRCQICGAETSPGLELGSQPIADLLLSPRQLNQPETLYPLHLHHCPDCGLTQLSYVVNPKIVYKYFPFLSGTTQTATRHLQSLPNHLVDLLGLNHRSFAVDIGSNDGTLLKGYLPHRVRFLGVDPAGDPVRIANDQGIPTLHAFFDEGTARYILALHQARQRGKKIIGIGAPAKASTVCNYCRIGPETLEYITEVNPLRIGMYLPGVRIPIVEEDRMFDDPRPPDAAMLFAWNYADEVVPKLRARGFQGEIYTP